MEKFISNYSAELKNETFFYLNTVDYNKIKKAQPTFILPYSLRFYTDTAQISTVPRQLRVILDSNITVPFDKYFRPFYFRKYEVTNGEYREFVNWVRDSIARNLLYADGMKQFAEETSYYESGHLVQNLKLNWEIPILWGDSSYMEILDELNLPENERFFKRKSIDTRKLNYRFHGKVNNLLLEKYEGREEKLINVYPDTLSWVHDFSYTYEEPMANMYFWHPAFNDYPVVGITFYQALAYLDWKTKMQQNEFDRKGIKLIIEYDLPTEIEWDVAATAEINNKKISVYTKDYYFLSDNSWITDLSLKDKNIFSRDSVDRNTQEHYITYRKDILHEQLKKNFIFKGKNDIDNGIYTQPCNIQKIKIKNKLLKINEDNLGICFMGGNVSEWLKESYKENWKPMFIKRQNILKGFDEKVIDSLMKNDRVYYDKNNCKSYEILSQIENYYDKNNDENGRLVRGSNWYDERFSNRLGKNTEGINAKLFVNPDSSYCTLGFRYVIHISEK